MEQTFIVEPPANRKRLFFSLAAVLCLSAAALYAWWPAKPPLTGEADRVVVIKSQRVMMLMRQGQLLKSYRVSLGRGGLEPKMREGDHRTPEGNYTLDYRNPRSRFHLALHVSYPNDVDIAKARRLGAAPGGSIMVHGIANGLGWLGRVHRLMDWTDGCIAVTNSEMEEIYRAVPTGTPIEIHH